VNMIEHFVAVCHMLPRYWCSGLVHCDKCACS